MSLLLAIPIAMLMVIGAVRLGVPYEYQLLYISLIFAGGLAGFDD